MSDPDRRYDRTSAEPPLTIDRRRRPQGRGPAPIALIVSLVLLLVVGGGVALMYRSGARGTADAPQPLGAPLGDVRAPAPPQAQTRDASDGLTISKDTPANTPTGQTLAPPPEQPLPDAPPPRVPSTTPAAPPPPPPAEPSQSNAPASTVAPGEAAGPHRPAKVVGGAKVESIDSLIAKAAKPAKPNKPPKAPPPPPREEAEGGALVQIGAFSSETLADREWSKAAGIAPGAMAGKGKRVAPVTRDGVTLYRTSITGFATREQAQSLCDKLRAAGGSCFVR